MKLIIVRHGETEENKAGIIQGQLPGKLSSRGVKQSKKLALRLRSEKITFIYSSDLARASDTAKEIIKFYPNISIQFVKDLREQFLGRLEGKSNKDVEFTDISNLQENHLKNWETSKELLDRASNFLYKIISQHPNDTVLFVGHGRINRALITALTDKSLKEMELIERLHNASVCIFEIDADRNHNTICFNCKKHLD